MKSFLKLSIFNILANLVIPIAGIADIFFVGQLQNQNPTAGVALGTIVFDVMFWSFGFLRMGTTATLSQLIGKEEKNLFRQRVFQTITVALILGLTLLILKDLIWDLVETLLAASPVIKQNTKAYFDVRILNSPITFITYVIAGYFLATQNGKMILITSLILNGLNIALNWLFINKYGMLADGVAWATVIATTTSLIISFLYIFFIDKLRPLISDFKKINFSFLKEFFQENTSLIIRTFLVIGVLSTFSNSSSYFSRNILIANTLILKVLAFIQYFMDGFTNSLESFIARAYAKNRYQEMKSLLASCLKLSLLVWVFGVLVLIIFGKSLIGHLNADGAVQELALEKLPHLYATLFFAAFAYCYDGLFIGVKAYKILMKSMIISALCFAAILIPAIFYQNNNTLWVSLIAFMLTRSLTLHFKRGLYLNG